MKIIIIFLSLLTLMGCGAIEKRGETLGGVADAVSNPDNTEAHYKREGNDKVNFIWIKCGGTYCGYYTVNIPEKDK